MNRELTPAALAVINRAAVSRRANEFASTGMTFCDEAAAAKGPTVLVVQNGSRFGGEDSADLNQLLALLAETPLDPRFEEYGNFIDDLPISARTEKPLLPTGWTMFHGNFFVLSHGFQIVTNDLEVIEELTRAIRTNQRRDDYAEAKAENAAWKNRRAAEVEARRKRS